MIDQKLLAKIRKMADSSDWGIREDAALKIKTTNDLYSFHRWGKLIGLIYIDKL